MLLQMVRKIGIQIEPFLRIKIENDLHDVYNFVKTTWTLSENGKFDGFIFHPGCQQILIIKVRIESMTKNVTIDLITGSFLVNHLPICRFSADITQSELFKSVFGDFVFEVQP